MADENQAEPAVHVKRFYSTKPGHKLLRSERCDCPQGSDHSVYETP